MTSATPDPNGPAGLTRAARDGIVLLAASVIMSAVLWKLDAFERFAVWSRRHERWQLDELLVLGAVGSVATSIFAFRRWRDSVHEMALRRQTEAGLKRLEGLLPICSFCKRIRNSEGAWIDVETYVMDRADVDFSHGVCAACANHHYPELMAD